MLRRCPGHEHVLTFQVNDNARRGDELVVVKRQFHVPTFTAVFLAVDFGEDEDVEDEQRAADGDGDGERGGVGAVAGDLPVLRHVAERRRVLQRLYGRGVTRGGGRAGGGGCQVTAGRGRARGPLVCGTGAVQRVRPDHPLVHLGAVVVGELVVLGVGTQRAGPVQLRNQPQPQGQLMRSVVVLNPCSYT